MVSGKGGVGKTSLSAALAVKYAAAGHDTLVVSTDPAHSLGDSLGQLLPGGAPVPIEGTDLPIWGMEIDPDKVTENFKAFASTGGKEKVQVRSAEPSLLCARMLRTLTGTQLAPVMTAGTSTDWHSCMQQMHASGRPAAMRHTTSTATNAPRMHAQQPWCHFCRCVVTRTTFRLSIRCVQGVLDKFGMGKLMDQLSELGLDELLNTPPPGLDEAIAIAKVVEFVESASYARFTRIIFDTAPTGHTMRMLTLPDFVASTLAKVRTLQQKLTGANRVVSALFGEGGSEKAVERLEALQARVEMVAALFRCAFFLRCLGGCSRLLRAMCCRHACTHMPLSCSAASSPCCHLLARPLLCRHVSRAAPSVTRVQRAAACFLTAANLRCIDKPAYASAHQQPADRAAAAGTRRTWILWSPPSPPQWRSRSRRGLLPRCSARGSPPPPSSQTRSSATPWARPTSA